MVEYGRYEKISDKIMDLTYYSSLKMNVILGHKDKNGRRLNFHREYSYQTDKYRNVSTLYGISRNFDCYLSIESYLDGKNNDKDFIMIRDENMIQLRFVLSRIYKLWIELGEENRIYITKDNNRIIVPRDTWNTEIVDLCMNKKLAFEPTVIKNPDGSEEKGIDVLLNSNYNKITMTHSRFMGFIYNINSIYIYQLAQNMINYLQRPELGVNMVTYGNYEQEEQNSIGGADKIQKGNSSVVTRKKNHSIFDEL